MNPKGAELFVTKKTDVRNRNGKYAKEYQVEKLPTERAVTLLKMTALSFFLGGLYTPLIQRFKKKLAEKPGKTRILMSHLESLYSPIRCSYFSGF